MTETTERFLKEIATRIGAERVAELYLFPVLRQGGVEGAVAVVAADLHPDPSALAPAEASALAVADDEAAPPAPATPGESGEATPAGEPVSSARAPRTRHVVYTARYRSTVKGPDRGRWAVDIVEEADAPLVTVEEVVRGVVRRSGEEFQPERLSGDQLRVIVRAPGAPGSAPA